MALKSFTDLKSQVKKRPEEKPLTDVEKADRALFAREMKRIGLDQNVDKSSIEDDTDLFLKEMQKTGVIPIKDKGKAQQAAPRLRTEPRAAVQRMNAAAEAANVKDTFVKDSETYLSEDASPDLLRKLRRGAWPIADRLDLHGLRVSEAKPRVTAFLRNSHDVGLRSVIIVHGRGLNSPEGPVLKDLVRSWVRQIPYVMAYIEAGPDHGGEGAIILLLAQKIRHAY
ncbi:MAG TPA: hypothetical protein DCW60_01000 [Sutterella sp.]|nr:hypothetical protein [Sutterella sp.]